MLSCLNKPLFCWFHSIRPNACFISAIAEKQDITDELLENVGHEVWNDKKNDDDGLGNPASQSMGSNSVRGNWTSEEDQLLRDSTCYWFDVPLPALYFSTFVAVCQYGAKCWKKISVLISGRSAIQCMQRWNGCLKPGLVKGSWTAEVI